MLSVFLGLSKTADFAAVLKRRFAVDEGFFLIVVVAAVAAVDERRSDATLDFRLLSMETDEVRRTFVEIFFGSSTTGLWNSFLIA